MEIGKINAFSALLIALSVAGYVGVYSYSSINKNKNVQCLADSVRGVSSDVAARELIQLCESSSDDNEPFVGSLLTDNEKSKITGRVGLDHPTFSPLLKGRLYNGNDSVTVKSVVILVEFKKDEKDVRSRTYVVSKKIQPLSTSDFSIPIIAEEGDMSWSIVASVGHKAKISVM